MTLNTRAERFGVRLDSGAFLRIGVVIFECSAIALALLLILPPSLVNNRKVDKIIH